MISDQVAHFQCLKHRYVFELFILGEFLANLGNMLISIWKDHMETIETLSKSIATYQILKDLRNSDHFKVALK